MARAHAYSIQVRWTGNLGEGTGSYRAYSRDHEISAEGKPSLNGSSDLTFRGDPSRYNPEELLVASVSACHMLWYLHLCADAGVVVVDYRDEASGTMTESPRGEGQFTQVTLRPKVTVTAGSDEGLARDLHQRAHELCFIANSVKFPIACEPSICRG